MRRPVAIGLLLALLCGGCARRSGPNGVHQTVGLFPRAAYAMFWGEDVISGRPATYEIPGRTIAPAVLVLSSVLVNGVAVGIPTIVHLARGGGDCENLGAFTLVGWCECGSRGQPFHACFD